MHTVKGEVFGFVEKKTFRETIGNKTIEYIITIKQC